MKYIMLKQTIGTVVRRVPIIFPDILVHNDIANAIQIIMNKLGPTEVISAGDITLLVNSTYGKSITLKLEAYKDDAEIINTYDYLYGIE